MLRPLSLLLVLFLAAPAFAQPSILGDWTGVLDISAVQPGGPQLTLVLHVMEEGDGFAATLDSPDQGAFGIPADEATFDGETLAFAVGSIGASYTGTVNTDGSQIEGTFNQGPMELPLVLMPYEAAEEMAAAADTKPAAIKPGDYSGSWAGAMPIPNGGEMRLTFHLTKAEDGSYTAVLDAPGQADNLDLGEIMVQGRSVNIDIMGQARFTGTVAEDERSMEGEMAQGDQKQPVTLTRQ
ncbi:MAG: hypothetical protein HKN04_04530 [Rhodothermaceae bacterium]|nr:hypothetical protein [Rhodothermaceae bacterium]